MKSRGLTASLCAAAAVFALAGMPSVVFGQDTEAPVAEHRPKLWVGDQAPALAIETWVRGTPVEQFEPGKTYVVEFWATWCGPCIQGMPHLTQIQKAFKDKGVTVIGVNIFDDPARVGPFMEQADENRMGYTVAIEKKVEGNAEEGLMAQAWMEPAEQGGIPTAFIVDGKGQIAFIGHPMWLDIPLEQIVAGTWDVQAGMKEIAEADKMLNAISGTADEQFEQFEKFEAKYPTVAHQDMITGYVIGLLAQNDKYDRLWTLVGRLVDEAIEKKNLWTLNMLSWQIVDPNSQLKERNLPLAKKAAEAAVEMTKEKDGAVLDTLARVYWLMGEKSKAIETQRKAVAAAKSEWKEDAEATLKEYEEGTPSGG